VCKPYNIKASRVCKPYNIKASTVVSLIIS